MAKPHAAEPQHGIELVQVLGAALHLLDRQAQGARHVPHLGFRVGQELVQRGIEQADRHRQARHDGEEAGEVLPLHRQELRQRGAPSPLRRRPGSSRAPTRRLASKNMCSVRQSPIPSAPKRRAASASAGVSALARTFMRRMASAQTMRVEKSPESSGSSIATRPFQHLAGGPVDRDDVALREPRRHSSSCGPRNRPGWSPRPKRRACPCRAPRQPRGTSCRRASSGCLRRRACR